MSIEPGQPGRECSAYLAQPVNQQERLEADRYVGLINAHNNVTVVYRSSDQERDIRDHVFRWNPRTPTEVFEHGFRSDNQGATTDMVYYDIEEYVNRAGQPMQPHANNFVFVSTTFSADWTPQTRNYTNQIVYRYEIYAPGGILVTETLRSQGQYENQREVLFVRGIHRQYIRSAQRFRLVLTNGGQNLARQRVDTILMLNPYFNPTSHPETRLLEIRYAVDCYYEDWERRQTARLSIEYVFPGDHMRKKREISITSPNFSLKDIWYAFQVQDIGTYITAAFRSSYKNEAYLFMGNEYVLVNYAPGSTNDRVLNGPLLICQGFLSIADTPFGENGIDCAFASRDKNEAYIFSTNLCARINFAPRTTDDWIIEGPMPISKMFPFFKGTGFENGVDAAFEYRRRKKYEAYVFKGNRYALINYKERKVIGGPKLITDGFYSLKDTMFESGIDAAFNSHTSFTEAYIFKGDHYALIDFAPGTTNDKIINGPKPIKHSWPSLSPVLPRKNYGLDDHYHVHPNRVHDEL